MLANLAQSEGLGERELEMGERQEPKRKKYIIEWGQKITLGRE